MDADIIRVLMEAQVGPLKSGTAEAAAVVKQATASMTADMASLAIASEASAAAMGGALAAGSARASHSVTEARHAVREFSQELGVPVSRGVASFLSRLSFLGPALAAAFTPLAIVGLIEVLGQIPEKIREITSAIVGWGEAEKKTYEESLKANQERIKFLERIRYSELELQLIGLEGSVKKQREIELSTIRYKDLTEQVKEAQRTIQKANTMLEGTHRETVMTSGGVPTTVSQLNIKEGSEEWKRLQAEIEAARKKTEAARGALEELDRVKFPQLRAELDELFKKEQDETKKTGEQRERQLEEQATKAAASEDVALGKARARYLQEFELGQQQADIRRRSAEAAGVAQLEAERANVEMLRALGEMSAEQEALRLADIENRRNAIKLESLEKRRGILQKYKVEHPENPAYIMQLEALNAEVEALAQDHEAKLLGLKNRAAVTEKTEHDQQREQADREREEDLREAQRIADEKLRIQKRITDHMVMDTQRVLDRMIFQSRSIGEVFSNLWRSIAEIFIQYLEKMLAKWIVTHILMRIFHISSATQQAATDIAITTSAEAIKHGIRATSNVAGVVSNAALAASVAYAAYAYLPPLAAAMAAQAFASVMSLAPLAAFEGGGIVPQDMVARLHAREMVLPENISTRLQQAMGDGGLGGGGIVVHYAPTVSAIDARGVREVLQAHSDVLISLFRQAKRDGQLA